MGCSLFLCATPVAAHLSFAVEFDDIACRDFTGVLLKLDWQSLHPYFFLDVQYVSGMVKSLSFQTYAPITLRRNGADRQLFIDNIGKEIWVRGCVAKNGKERYAAAGTLKFSDGILRQVGQIQQ